MTNGEMIQTIFPNEEMYEQTPTMTYYGMMRFDTEWWNMEYKEPSIQERQAEIDKFDAAFQDGYDHGYAQARFDYEQELTTKNNLGVSSGLEKNSKKLEKDFGELDCISRVEVKKIAKEMYLEVANMELDVNTISDCISYTSSKCREVLERKLQALSSVTPIRPKGHWIDREVYDADRWKCSECGRTEQYKENYCPNCGAKMESEE